LPRNSSGIFTLLNSAFIPGTTISSSAVNGDLSDIATALSQSVASTGVTSITAPLKFASGSVGSPSYTFASAPTTGFYLAGTNQIGWAAAGAQGATFNADLSVTWNGNATWAGNVTFNGTSTYAGASTLTGNVTLNATTYTFGAGAAAAWWLGIATKVDLTIVIDGGGTVILGGQKGQLHIPYPMTISKWWVMADQSGSITVDILRANNGVPSTSIVGGGNMPLLSSSQFNSASPSGWTATTLATDDFIAFNVTGTPSSTQRVTVALTCTRTG